MIHKSIILEMMDRDALKRLSIELDLIGVDRRSVGQMRAALKVKRSATTDVVIGSLKLTELRRVAADIGITVGGNRSELTARLKDFESTIPNSNRKPSQRKRMQAEATTTNASPPSTEVVAKKKPAKLTLPRLERKLFEACDILRGNMDASEYKEFIFGMLFLKRLSDQFASDRTKLTAEYESKGLKPALIEKQLDNLDKYDFFVPLSARWSAKDEKGRNTGIAHLKTSVGSGLNKALAAIEDANPNTLQDVLKGINFNRKVGQRSMDDDTLVAFIQHFNDLPLANDDFEFPDLLGAAFDYLIKYFADSAGKKGGEFFTPPEVVQLNVQIIEPKEGMSIDDPAVGSGGMLIQSKQYVQETGGDPRNLELAGQELNGGTWAICKMNMLLHGIRSADVRQGDTIKEPQHLDKNGEIRRFDRVIANPPFSQNYLRNGMQFPERFHTFMPEGGKKADLMFVQHMVASLKSDGKLSVVMPHGVLFRGGEEKACRQRFIKDGILEAVIGLPSNLFYGTGIPACILVINKHGASKRKSVLFINADREYKEGKNQNSLRPEDIEKITHVYRNRLSVSKYSREVPIAELEKEEFNLNIRRYVDNSPPPEPHDVRAHLHGGIPLSEITLLTSYYDNYAGLRSLLFQSSRHFLSAVTEASNKLPADGTRSVPATIYADFTAAITSKQNIKTLVESAPGLQAKHAEFHQSLDAWWKGNVKRLEKLPETQNVFEFRRQCIDGLSKALVPHQLLDVYQARGAVAAYIKSLDSDLKSIAASGWGPELIPDDEILQSQFPEVLEQIEQETARIAELEGLFAAVSGGDEEEGEVEVDAENGVLPKSLVKSLKEEKKNLGGEIKEAKKRARNEGRSGVPAEVAAWEKRIEEIDAQLARHVALDDELKTLKAHIREVEKQKETLIASARSKITEAEAKKLILARFKRLLTEQFDGYLRQYQQAFIAAVENLWSKYAVTTKQILAERDQEAAQLNAFLKELGYE